MWSQKALAILSLLAGLNELGAGIYNPAEPEKRYAHFDTFEKETLFPLKTIAADRVDQDNPLRMRYVLMADIAPRSFPAGWTAGQRLSIEAYLIRRRKYVEAIELITPQIFRERQNFLQMSNLSMAYFLAGQEPHRAVDYLKQTLETWPASLQAAGPLEPVLKEMGWDERSLQFFKDTEKVLLKLFRLRATELRRKTTELPQAADDLFDVKFIGDSGKFEARKLAADQRAKLPANALDIVQQLLIWMPDDPRLYWLLGELYNARAEGGRHKLLSKKEQKQAAEQQAEDFKAAVKIFDYLAGYNGPLRVPACRDQLQVLRAASPPEIPADEDDDRSTPVDWRALGVGFMGGALVAFLAYWQVRELRRRRQKEKVKR